jgi:hypothetical protein
MNQNVHDRDPHHGTGGRYVMKDGKRVRVEEPTRPADSEPQAAEAVPQRKPAAARKSTGSDE